MLTMHTQRSILLSTATIHTDFATTDHASLRIYTQVLWTATQSAPAVCPLTHLLTYRRPAQWLSCMPSG
jgi:hypothetical protein